MMKSIVGTGILLRAPNGKYLLQERDIDLERNPGRIAPFGGGVEGEENVLECAVRELKEELELETHSSDLQAIGSFESHYRPGTFIQLYLLDRVDPAGLVLREGQNIVELSLSDALQNDEVTDFTKEVLRSLSV